ncbi:AAA family ATPase [Listeria sp. FSL L7-1509]|uniref:AAA family ATPase n=1 Tax=Listeria immobilis TaxID=2713502 RepID=A0ABR6T0Y6_9LIST|nr:MULTISPECIES: AAA family ATPase [Listeria]MBC1484510.1 AAA family ATPase [Listeria immobilis]MBC1508251.1 AAA family ATPase [Listeria immobilis]MBC1511283.1 AAA family ATPase [Listeria immobilis]MBC1839609.1 AAA family ATPase [Listeria seeligeri]MBC6313698.1 AAA family ATPase [Listeria immobilis]
MIRDEIVEWVREQPYWQQVGADAILSGIKINESLIDEVYLALKQEYKLEGSLLTKKALAFLSKATKSKSISNVTWDEVSEVKGVNALSPKSSIPVGRQLTIIYGLNGSGKSGYARLLNNAFISRGDKNILPNIFQKEENVIPSAKFVFKNEKGDSETLVFPEDHKNELFSRVAVFDSKSATNDLTKDVELNFAPIEFNFFDEFNYLITEVKNRLNDDIKEKNKENNYVRQFPNNTLIGMLVKSINSNMEYVELESASKTTHLKEKLQKKTERKSVLVALNIMNQQKLLEKRKTELNGMKSRIKEINAKFSSEQIDDIKNLIQSRNDLEKISISEGITQLDGEHIYQIGSPEWKEFIESAKQYYGVIQEEIDHCIFCGQKIDGVTVIDKYWIYLKSSAESELSQVDSDIKMLIQDFKNFDCKLLTKDSGFEEWLKENIPNLHSQLISWQTQVETIKENLIQNLTILQWEKESNAFKMEETICNEALKCLEKEISELNTKKVQQEIDEIEKFENEYNDKLRLKDFLPEIKVFLEDLKWVDAANNITISTQKATRFQKSLFSQYVTDKYVERFNEECKKLNADFSAEIKQRGSKGNTLSKLIIKDRKPIEILSEGEQRAITIANFLAETSLDNKNTCIVLDDPVSSLDVERKEAIGRRLVDEAKQKQVVVFTHDITFVNCLDRWTENKQVECSIVPIRNFNNVSGLREDNEPWIATPVKRRIGYLKNELQAITKKYNSINSEKNMDLYKEYIVDAKYWCEKLRETWERMIEEIIFMGAITRFTPAIQTKSLKKVVFNAEIYREIEEGMSLCSDWVHDRPLNSGENYPKPVELQNYLEACERFKDKYKK